LSGQQASVASGHLLVKAPTRGEERNDRHLRIHVEVAQITYPSSLVHRSSLVSPPYIYTLDYNTGAAINLQPDTIPQVALREKELNAELKTHVTMYAMVDNHDTPITVRIFQSD